jgi:cation transport regulator ChaC
MPTTWSTRLCVFAYGSLIATPERPDLLLERRPARLVGLRRSFNKRSHARACPADEAFDAFPEAREGFREEGVNLSLSLGTVADPGAAIEGVVLVYRAASREAVLPPTDRREGVLPGRPTAENGYVRAERQVTLLDSGQELPAVVYLSNDESGCRYHVPEHVPEELRAKVLVNATPRHGLPVKGRLRGLLYLEDARCALAGFGIRCPQLEQTAGAVHALEGPWRELLAFPGR